MAFTEADQVEMFGCTAEAHRHGMDYLVSHMDSRFGDDANRALASILSDVQALIETGQNGRARQYLNRVKHALYEAAPITLWGLESIRANAEVAHECCESIRLAARKTEQEHYVLANGPYDAVFFGPFDTEAAAVEYAEQRKADPAAANHDFVPMSDAAMRASMAEYGVIPIQTPGSGEED